MSAASSASSINSTTGSTRGKRTAHRTSCWEVTGPGEAGWGEGLGFKALIGCIPEPERGSSATLTDFSRSSQGTKVLHKVTPTATPRRPPQQRRREAILGSSAFPCEPSVHLQESQRFTFRRDGRRTALTILTRKPSCQGRAPPRRSRAPGSSCSIPVLLPRPWRNTNRASADEAEIRSPGIAFKTHAAVPPSKSRSAEHPSSVYSGVRWVRRANAPDWQELAVTWPNKTFVPQKPQKLLLLG